ncbi:Central kinetochore associated protein [Komagataella phaffii CBS 7435]|uniref:Protein required for oxidation of specific cysteine residues of the transcription factor Yap1p n=2 Tax=Komagataella phaffii TaxID=460519 RepID=C4R4C1_KOMPG|nr:Protein required for oxidation of specific cysteine residues of the transcription factor Yap1p [Komagataella phaffii GS115]AOA63911.1 GQ67_03427T0 [Komagataella phaffii]CAH2449842.1 Central kinetochore associated protein [Komagataella phaffii CBS 7435]AOA68872.1 GQ68_03396T0 [Komagataella phaffii GS115]CAY70407.1 Protein required for oxidation of specific cysteine residues of the transcription factor Yap1p [Komagataella phaffii GS115]CCA39804.1 Central kinetochore associated protein [Komaga
MTDSNSTDSELEKSSKELLTVDTICHYLDDAAQDALETKDYLSYLTVIDIHLATDPEKFSVEERIQLLEKLLKILQENDELLYEIGWDIPALLFQYHGLEWDDLRIELKNSKGRMAMFHIFELLAEKGNAKELLLKCCELLPRCVDSSSENNDIIFKLRFHSLFELMVASQRRIVSNYPSRFLAMMIPPVINLLSNKLESPIFVLRRIYTLLRDYHPCLRPDVSENTTAEDIRELSLLHTQENYLQRKLLTTFLTHSIELQSNTIKVLVAPTVFEKLEKSVHSQKLGLHLNSEFHRENMILLGRFVTLSQSYDINLEEEIKKQIEETETLFSQLDHNQELDTLNDKIFSLVIENFNGTGLHDKDLKELPLSSIGCIILYTFNVLIENPSAKSYSILDFEKVVKLSLRFLLPSMLNPNLTSYSLDDALYAWAWVTVSKENNLSQIPEILITTYLQLLITKSTINFSDYLAPLEAKSRNIILYTLISRVLSLVHESTSWNFLKDSLTTCPFNNARSVLLSILKDLCLRSRNITVASLNDKLEKVDLNTKPTIPARDIPYITLSQARGDDIVRLATDTVNKTLAGKEVKEDEVILLLSYINFITALKSKIEPQSINRFIELVNKKLKNIDPEDNNGHLIKLAVERVSQ